MPDDTRPPTHRIPTRRKPRNRRAIAITTGIAAMAAGIAALTLTLTDHHTPPPATPTTADPLTGAALHGTPDHTGAAHNDATQALKVWGASSIGTTPGRAGVIRAVLRIPALGKTWSEPIYNGVGDEQLAAGIGHFPDTENPGQIGNYALAGHRSGVAAPPLRNINNITTGSTIQVITSTRITYTYTVTKTTTVAPTDVAVIAQVPGNPKATPTQAELTLITCWPADGHSRRVVIEARLTSSRGGT